MILNANSIYIPLADSSVHMAVTSPPYYGLRDYGLTGTDWDAVTYTPMAGLPPVTVEAWRGCLGLEPTPEMFVAHIVAVFREVWRVLRDDGTCWVNFGDSYASGKGKCNNPGGGPKSIEQDKQRYPLDRGNVSTLKEAGLKPKDLLGIPWRVAFALQADGWYLRSDIIWHKPNPMPESVTDRCTKSHEYLFMLAKSQRYFYDNEAVKEDFADERNGASGARSLPYSVGAGRNDTLGTPGKPGLGVSPQASGRNRRDVWSIPPHNFKGAHFATFPPDLVRPCVLAGTSQQGVCPVCGSPWERVTVKNGFTEHGGSRKRADAPGAETSPTSVFRTGLIAHQETTGWRPTCDCPGLDGDSPGSDCADDDNWPTIPATVLDPFCGSGTTGQVCHETQRKFVGLDLSARYLRDFALIRAEHKQTVESIEVMPLFSTEAL